MNGKKDEPKFTSLVGVKWTQESLLLCLHDMYVRYYSKLINNKKLSKEEKIARACKMAIQFRSIYNPIFNYGVTVKK